MQSVRPLTPTDALTVRIINACYDYCLCAQHLRIRAFERHGRRACAVVGCGSSPCNLHGVGPWPTTVPRSTTPRSCPCRLAPARWPQSLRGTSVRTVTPQARIRAALAHNRRRHGRLFARPSRSATDPSDVEFSRAPIREDSARSPQSLRPSRNGQHTPA